MAGDRSGLRKLYPGILDFTEAEILGLFEGGTPRGIDRTEFGEYVRALAADVQLIRAGVRLVAWRELSSTMPSQIRTGTLEFCFQRLRLASQSPTAKARARAAEIRRALIEWLETWPAQAEGVMHPLTRDQQSSMTILSAEWADLYLGIPPRRLLSLPSWISPFDAVDADLCDANFPVPEDLLDEMHSHVDRGHGWFGVAEWSLAALHYVGALTIAIVTNNRAAVEAVSRFLTDTYAGAGDSRSAVDLAEDYLAAPGTPKQEPFGVMTKEMLEAVAVAHALAKRLDRAREWVERIHPACGLAPDPSVASWNIIELLTDVHQFRSDRRVLLAINTTVAELQAVAFPAKSGRAATGAK